jgi:phasin
MARHGGGLLHLQFLDHDLNLTALLCCAAAFAHYVSFSSESYETSDHARASRPEVSRKTALQDKAMTTNPAKIADTPFKTMAQNGSSQAKEASETMSRVTAESADLIKHFYVTGLKGAHEYNAKVMECAKSNTEASFSFVQKLADVKSPSDFLELATDYSRRQFETLTEQTKDLTALAQKVTIATVEPLKSAVSKTFGR